MNIEWIGCSPANYRTGRSGHWPEAIVVHIVCGSLQSATANFGDPASSVSAHYGVGRDGRVLQYVKEEDTAFHAGIVVSPVWKLIRGGTNPNLYTIGIEHEGQPEAPWSGVQYAASAELTAEIASRWNIPVDKDHIVLHREIRASKICPGDAFDRNVYLERARTAASSDGLVRLIADVDIVGNVNARNKPNRSGTILRVISAGEHVRIAGYTTKGERVDGNSSWYLTAEGDFFWSGASNRPTPSASTPATLVVEFSGPQPTTRFSASGLARLDGLRSGNGPELAPGADDIESVGAVQDLLSGHGHRGLPSIVSNAYGLFGDKTRRAVQEFQQSHQLTVTGSVDASTLRSLISTPAADPRASKAYLTLCLENAYGPMERALSMVAQMEGMGRFASLNLNADQAGLSIGIIQWAQRPKRLSEILEAFCKRSQQQFVALFGDGDEHLANGLLAHVRRPSGGIDSKTGITMDPAYDLVCEPWAGRFRNAALLKVFQETQVAMALAAFRNSYRLLAAYAPDVRSERAVAFMLDVINQYGDAGARNLYTFVRRDGMTEGDLLQEIADESVERIAIHFQSGVRHRREVFLSSAHFSQDPFPVATAAGL